MVTRHFWALVSLIATCVSLPVGKVRVVDMTHKLNNQTVYWPGNRPFQLDIETRGPTVNLQWYESNWFGSPEHSGTHVDAPAHFFRGNWRVDEIPADRLIGPAVVINITDKAAQNPDYRVSVSDLQAWESAHGTIPKGAMVLLNSDWGKKYPNKSLIFNSPTPDNTSTFHFPGFHEAGVQWLIDNRQISMIGTDTPSTDYGQSTDFPVHILAGEHNIPGIENVANLNLLPPRGVTLYVAVIKLDDGSGGPARILATVPENLDATDSTPKLSGFSTSSLAIVSLILYCFIF